MAPKKPNILATQEIPFLGHQAQKMPRKGYIFAFFSRNQH